MSAPSVKIEEKVTPNSLVTLDRKLRPVGKLFKRLAHDNAGSELTIDGVPKDEMAVASRGTTP